MAEIRGLRCVVCRDLISASGVACVACGATHHAPCWERPQACGTCQSAKGAEPFRIQTGRMPWTAAALAAIAVAAMGWAAMHRTAKAPPAPSPRTLPTVQKGRPSPEPAKPGPARSPAPRVGHLDIRTPFPLRMSIRSTTRGGAPREVQLTSKAMIDLEPDLYELRFTGDGRLPWTTRAKIEARGFTRVTAWAPALPCVWSYTGPLVVKAAVDLDGDGFVEVIGLTELGQWEAISARSGRTLWTQAITTGRGSWCEVVPARDLDRDGGPDLVVRMRGSVSAVSGLTGRVVWSVDVPEPVAEEKSLSTPTPVMLEREHASEDVVIVPSASRVLALDGRTGRERWAFRAPGAVAGEPLVGDLDGDRTPDVVFGTSARTIHAVSAKTGAEMWNAGFDGLGPCHLVLARCEERAGHDVLVHAGDHIKGCHGHDGAALWHRRADGMREAIASERSGTAGILTWTPDGRTLQTSAAGAQGVSGSGAPIEAVHAGNLDGNGAQELVIVGKQDLRVLDADTWELRAFLQLRLTDTRLVDFDGDGVMELLGKRDGGAWQIVRLTAAAPVVTYTTDDVMHNPVGIGGAFAARKPAMFLRDRERIYCVDAEGHLNWWFAIPGPPAFGPCPITVADLDRDGDSDVLLRGDRGELIALDGSTRRRMWSAAPQPSAMAIPVADLDGDGRLEVLATSQNLRVLDAASGQPRWELAVGDGPFRLTVGDADGDGVNDILAESSHALHLIDVRTRTIRWSWSFEGHSFHAPWMGRIASRGDPVVLLPVDRVLHAIDGPRGRLLWSARFDEQIYDVPQVDPAREKGTVLVVVGGSLQALDAKDGRVVWSDREALGGVRSARLHDVDDDGRLDIVMEVDSGSRLSRALIALSGPDHRELFRYELEGMVGHVPPHIIELPQELRAKDGRWGLVATHNEKTAVLVPLSRLLRKPGGAPAARPISTERAADPVTQPSLSQGVVLVPPTTGSLSGIVVRHDLDRTVGVDAARRLELAFEGPRVDAVWLTFTAPEPPVEGAPAALKVEVALSLAPGDRPLRADAHWSTISEYPLDGAGSRYARFTAPRPFNRLRLSLMRGTAPLPISALVATAARPPGGSVHEARRKAVVRRIAADTVELSVGARSLVVPRALIELAPPRDLVTLYAPGQPSLLRVWWDGEVQVSRPGAAWSSRIDPYFRFLWELRDVSREHGQEFARFVRESGAWALLENWHRPPVVARHTQAAPLETRVVMDESGRVMVLSSYGAAYQTFLDPAALRRAVEAGPIAGAAATPWLKHEVLPALEKQCARVRPLAVGEPIAIGWTADNAPYGGAAMRVERVIPSGGATLSITGASGKTSTCELPADALPSPPVVGRRLAFNRWPAHKPE